MKRWPGAPYLPGMSPFPSDVQMPRKRPRKPARDVMIIHEVQLSEIESPADRAAVAKFAHALAAEHSHARAARAGRRSALMPRLAVTPTDPGELRAFEVGRDRRLAWFRGHKDPALARLAGRDNRSARRERR